MADTVATLIDQAYREYLTPAREQEANALLEGAVSTNATSLIYRINGFTAAEINLLGLNVIVGIDSELYRVTAVNTTTRTLTVLPHVLGTTTASHLDNASIFIASSFPRLTVFDAICDAIEGLYDELYRIKTCRVPVDWVNWVEAPADVEDVIGVTFHAGGRLFDGGVQFFRFMPDSGTDKAFQFDGQISPFALTSSVGKLSGGEAYVTYKAAFGRPSVETNAIDDDTKDWYLKTRWYKIVVLRAVADLAGGLDFDQATQEYITESLEAEAFPVGSGEKLQNALLRLAEFKMAKARAALRASHRHVMAQDGYIRGAP